MIKNISVAGISKEKIVKGSAHPRGKTANDKLRYTKSNKKS